MRVLEGQDHRRLVGLVVVLVRLDRQLARAGGRDLMLNDVLLAQAREAREAPGGGRRERARYDESTRRHRCAFFFTRTRRRRSAALIAVATRPLFAQAAATWDFKRSWHTAVYALVIAQMPMRGAVDGKKLISSTSTTAFDSLLLTRAV